MEYYGYRGVSASPRYYWRLLRNRVLEMCAYFAPAPGLAACFQRLRGVKIGSHVYIGPRVQLDFLYPEMVTIEDYVSIGMNSMVFAHSNPTSSLELKTRFYPRKVARTIIKKGAWIAPGNIILSGVTIGENSVVGAGSVVVSDVEPYTVVAGNPARLVKRLASNGPG